ncbi:MAG: hypothetical protein IKG62_05860 [Lachnospiraceae bacterium]|nr:hypothetical protein [Lachnospiraceae bacterium]
MRKMLTVDEMNMVAGGEEYRNHVMYGKCEIWANCDSSAFYGEDDGKAVEYNGPLQRGRNSERTALYHTGRG